MKVVIVGGGISGLAAAYTLHKKGIDAVVLEEKSVAGGRTVGDTQDGFVLDHGALFFMKCYGATYKLIDELGLTGDLVPIQYKSALWLDGQMVSQNPFDGLGGILKAPQKVFTKKRLGFNFYFQLSKMLYNAYKRRDCLDFVDYSNALDLDNHFFSDYVLKNGGREVLEYFSSP